MTFDDDSLVLETPSGRKIVRCVEIGMGWPPPETILINDVPYLRVSLSTITDEQREAMTHVFRGALYKLSGSVQ